VRRTAQILGDIVSMTCNFSRAAEAHHRLIGSLDDGGRAIARFAAAAHAAKDAGVVFEDEPETLTGDGEEGGPRCRECQCLLPPGSPDGDLCSRCFRGNK